MAISKALLWVAFGVNSFAIFYGAAAARNQPTHPSANPYVASDQESSKLLIKISYAELFSLFGSANITDIKNNYEEEDFERDEQDMDKIVEILQQNQDKIAPLLHKIEEAFGTTTIGQDATRIPALGFLEVTTIPLKMVALRKTLLPKAAKIANLPTEELSALEKPEMGFSIGWSHGKESFRVQTTDNNKNISDASAVTNRRYDTAKGSFYMNPYADTSIQNVYPPTLQPSLEDDLLIMTRFMSKVGLWIAILCDLYLDATVEFNFSKDQQCPCPDDPDSGNASNTNFDFASSISGNQWMVYKSLKYGKSAMKARLLYYFPQGQQKQNGDVFVRTNSDNIFDDWCGWHTDHGTLTALLPGMLCGGNVHNQEEREPTGPTKSTSSGTKPGLYIKTNMPMTEDIANESELLQYQQKPLAERLVHVNLAQDSLGFQLGETLEILSRGSFTATTHAVKAPPSSATNSSLGRASLAVFLQPLASQVLPPLTETLNSREGKDTSGGEFSLSKRWRSTFGEFQRVTLESFS